MKKALARLTRMMLNAIDKRLPKAERDLWQRQAWFMVKHLEAKVESEDVYRLMVHIQKMRTILRNLAEQARQPIQERVLRLSERVL